MPSPGAGFERQFARTIKGRRTPRSGANGGGDITPDGATMWKDWSWEGKLRESLPKGLTGPLAQAEADIAIGDRRRPAMFVKEHGGRIIVAFYWDDLRQWVSALAEVGRAGRVRDLGRELERIAHELKGVK